MTSRCEAIANNKFSKDTLRNAAVAKLYEEALLYDGGSITDNGGLAALSGEKTGRSPKDKRIVEEDASKDDIWWGEINRPLSPAAFEQVRQRAVDFLDTSEHFYVWTRSPVGRPRVVSKFESFALVRITRCSCTTCSSVRPKKNWLTLANQTT